MRSISYHGFLRTILAESFFAILVAVSSLAPAAQPSTAGPSEITDAPDPTYGCRVRRIRNDAGHEHNLYYYRDPWNADGSRLAAIQSDLDQKNWRVCLYDGDGVFLKELFPITQYDWRICWDRKDPAILYTSRASRLFRFNVETGKAELLKDFAPKMIMANGASLNQAGDRILVTTGDRTFHSFHLPDMTAERTFKPEVPPGCTLHWDKPHYTGHGNTIDTAYSGGNPPRQAIVIYEDTGKIFHNFDGIGGGGHYDCSPEGKLAYFKLPSGGRGAARTPFEIHVVDFDGTNDRVLFSQPAAQVRFHNLHLSWPRGVGDWFIASFFPSSSTSNPENKPPYDEIMMLKLDGTTRYLARTGTIYTRAAGRGQAGDMFWAQPLGRPSFDGRRILFNSSAAGTIDLCILYPE